MGGGGWGVCSRRFSTGRMRNGACHTIWFVSHYYLCMICVYRYIMYVSINVLETRKVSQILYIRFFAFFMWWMCSERERARERQSKKDRERCMSYICSVCVCVSVELSVNLLWIYSLFRFRVLLYRALNTYPPIEPATTVRRGHTHNNVSHFVLKDNNFKRYFM